MKKEQGGYIVVETILSFMLFVFFVTSILSLINVVVVQARVHYALTEAAQAVSMYDYCLSAVGLEDDVNGIANQANTVRGEANNFKSDINVVIDGISKIAGSTSATEFVENTYDNAGNIVEHGSSAIDRGYSWEKSIVNDPKAAISKIIAYGTSEVSREFFESVIRPVVGRYLSNGEMNGDAYLKSMNVVGGLDGLSFHSFDLLDMKTTTDKSSTFLTNNDVKLCVQYEIEYKFGALPLPFDALKVTQTVMTKAWLGGEGEGYVPNTTGNSGTAQGTSAPGGGNAGGR